MARANPGGKEREAAAPPPSLFSHRPLAHAGITNRECEMTVVPYIRMYRIRRRGPASPTTEEGEVFWLQLHIHVAKTPPGRRKGKEGGLGPP